MDRPKKLHNPILVAVNYVGISKITLIYEATIYKAVPMRMQNNRYGIRSSFVCKIIIAKTPTKPTEYPRKLRFFMPILTKMKPASSLPMSSAIEKVYAFT
jgi:hypothetical protein